ncbi:MAG: Integrase, catalytic region [Bryobacterales bacterium]|nr:Integrase, catalytic region [Bryobacterales bacterium]
MSREKYGWGAPRTHGELLKLGIDIGETSVSKYLVRSRKPPSDLANLPGKPSPEPRVPRLLHRADHPVSDVVRVPDAGARASAHRSLRGDSASHSRVDGSPASGSLSVGEGTAIFVA